MVKNDNLKTIKITKTQILHLFMNLVGSTMLAFAVCGAAIAGAGIGLVMKSGGVL